MPDRLKLTILCALPMEARAIEKAIAGKPVGVQVIGMGAKRVPIIECGACLIVAGLAGALDPELRVGDVVLDVTRAPNLQSLRLDSPDSPWRIGRIHTSDRAVCSIAEKGELYSQTGALAVDMEQAVVRAAAPESINIIGIRAISDPAHMSIDPTVLRFVDADTGRPRPLVAAGALLRRPSLIPHLRELNSNAKLALQKLANAVAHLVEQLSRPN